MLPGEVYHLAYSDPSAALSRYRSMFVSDAERELLAEIYPAADYPLPYSLWRVPLSHFSSEDLNWPPHIDGDTPHGDDPNDPVALQPSDPCKGVGSSFILCDTRERCPGAHRNKHHTDTGHIDTPEMRQNGSPQARRQFLRVSVDRVGHTRIFSAGCRFSSGAKPGRR
jgi:hypothetical protein